MDGQPVPVARPAAVAVKVADVAHKAPEVQATDPSTAADQTATPAPRSSSARTVPSSSAGPCMQVYVNCSSGLLELDIQPSDTTEVPASSLAGYLPHHLLALAICDFACIARCHLGYSKAC